MEKRPTGFEPVKRGLHWDERMIAFERVADTPLISPAIVTSVVAQVNIARSKVAPSYVWITVGKISSRRRLSRMAGEDVSSAILLRFKKEIIEVVRKTDKRIINVMANESWAELKVFGLYERYRYPEGLPDLWEQIEGENEGVLVPPFSMR